MDTPCKNCEWAIYDILTQTGCKLSVIDKFKKQEINIIEAYDEEKDFFVIQSVCPYFRNINPDIDNVWKYSGKPDNVEQVLKEVQFKYDLVIYIDENTTEKQIKNTTNSIWDLTILPSETIIISNWGKIKPSFLRSEFDGLKYRIELTVDQLSYDDCINLTSTKSQSPFFVIVRAGYKIKEKFIDQLDSYIKDCKPFLIFVPKNKDLNKLTINNNLFELVGRNTEKTFLDKLVNIPDYKTFTIYE